MNNHYDKQFFDKQKNGSIISAKEIVPIIIENINPKSVVDIGCGLGGWLKVFVDNNIDDIIGMDGRWVEKERLYINKKNFLIIDLENPKYNMNKIFDLAISLEVAEHIDKNVAEKFIQFLIRLSPIIVFSAAIPFQGGRNHINEQWPDYWANLFKKFDYYPVDNIRRKIWGNKRIEWWYRQNLIIFADKKYIDQKGWEIASSFSLSLVHPEKYSLLVNELNNIKQETRIARKITMIFKKLISYVGYH